MYNLLYYRGFDFGNHFCEWMYDYSNKEFPKFHNRPEDYPTRAQQVFSMIGIIRCQFMLCSGQRLCLCSIFAPSQFGCLPSSALFDVEAVHMKAFARCVTNDVQTFFRFADNIDNEFMKLLSSF